MDKCQAWHLSYWHLSRGNLSANRLCSRWGGFCVEGEEGYVDVEVWHLILFFTWQRLIKNIVWKKKKAGLQVNGHINHPKRVCKLWQFDKECAPIITFNFDIHPKPDFCTKLTFWIPGTALDLCWRRQQLNSSYQAPAKPTQVLYSQDWFHP